MEFHGNVSFVLGRSVYSIPLDSVSGHPARGCVETAGSEVVFHAE